MASMQETPVCWRDGLAMRVVAPEQSENLALLGRQQSENVMSWPNETAGASSVAR